MSNFLPGRKSNKGSHLKILKTRSRRRKGVSPVLDDVPAKKIQLFAMEGFFLDRGLLMGA
jgi:hypothetical protein